MGPDISYFQGIYYETLEIPCGPLGARTNLDFSPLGDDSAIV